MRNNIPKFVFLSSLVITLISSAFIYGVFAQRNRLPPAPQLMSIYWSIAEILNPSDQIMEYTGDISEQPVETLLEDELQPGLLMVATNIGRRQTAVRVIDRNGEVLHEWIPLFSEIWPDGEGTFIKRPEADMFLHGIEILPDGSLVANFENLSTFRLSPCGEIIWKLDNNGHHSVHYAEDGTLWVSAEDHLATEPTGYPNHKAPLRSWTLQNLTLDGEVLRSIPVIDIFFQNGIEGLLYNSSLSNGAPVVSGDTLHLNDIDIFPSNLQSDVFEPGDIMFSLRNISGVFVVDSETLEIKFQSLGQVMRQHDPDFLPGDRISVFDNRNFTRGSQTEPARSRIVELDAKTGALTVALGEEESEYAFYTEIMGEHERLENGNMLIVSSTQGRVMEFTDDGRLAWRMDNTVGDKNLSVMAASVLPEQQDEAFFSSLAKSCAASN